MDADKKKETEAESERKTELSAEKKEVLENKRSGKKVEILLKNVGDAPILKQSKWAVDEQMTVASLIIFLRTLFKLDDSESLFLYINQCFSPSPDQTILNLKECYAPGDAKLVINYSKMQAWG